MKKTFFMFILEKNIQMKRKWRKNFFQCHILFDMGRLNGIQTLLEEVPTPGDIVFAKFRLKWWPAMVIDKMNLGLPPPAPGLITVLWFGDNRIGDVSNVCKFDMNFDKIYKRNQPRKYQTAVTDAIKEMCSRAGFIVSKDALISLAKNKFFLPHENVTLSSLGSSVSSAITEKLETLRKRFVLRKRHARRKRLPKVSHNPKLPVFETLLLGKSIENNFSASYGECANSSNESSSSSFKSVGNQSIAGVKRKTGFIQKNGALSSVEHLPKKRGRPRKQKPPNGLNTLTSKSNQKKETVHQPLCNYGDVVFARYHKQWWPAMAIRGLDCKKPPAKDGTAWVLWFGESNYSQVSKVCSFVDNFLHHHKSVNTPSFRKSIKEAIKEVCTRNNVSVRPDELFNFASNDFFHEETGVHLSGLGPTMSPMMKSKVNNLVVSSDESEVEDDSEKEKPLSQVRRGAVPIQNICVSCDMNNAKVRHQHPIIEGGLCNYCAKHLKRNLFSYSMQDKLYTHCFLCASENEPVICDNIQCYRSFCVECIEMLVSKEALDIVRRESPWLCYLCREYEKETFGLIEVKPNWLINSVTFAQPNKALHFDDEIILKEKRAISALSLYKAVDHGLDALNELGLEMRNYTGCNIELEDSKELTRSKLSEMGTIDLILCVLPSNENLTDNLVMERFFKFFKTFEDVQIHNLRVTTPLFFLFGLSASVSGLCKDVISTFLQSEVTVSDSSRLNFWGNIPALHLIFQKPECSQEALLRPLLSHLMQPLKSFYGLRADHLN